MSGWARAFDEPIGLPNGRKLATLREAGEYIAALPAKAQKSPQWKTAAQALMLVVETDGHAMLARIALVNALNYGKAKPPTEARRKRAGGFLINRGSRQTVEKD